MGMIHVRAFSQAENQLQAVAGITASVHAAFQLALHPAAKVAGSCYFFFCFFLGFGGAARILRSASSNGIARRAPLASVLNDLKGVLLMLNSFSIPPSLPKSCYAAVGEIVTKWAHLEWNLERIIWRLLGMSNREGRILTTGMSARTKIEIIDATAKHYTKDQTIKDAVVAINHRARPLADYRNNLVHGVFGYPGNKSRSLHLIKVAGNKKYRISPKPSKITVKEIAEQAKQISALNADAAWAVAVLSLTRAP